MTIAMICIAFVIVLTVYCVYEWKERFTPATAWKVALSGAIAVLAWVFWAQNGAGNLTTMLIACGLTFAVPADFFLQYMNKDDKKYTAGILFFSLMHASLLTGFFWQYIVHFLEFILFAVILTLMTILEKAERWNLGKESLPLSIYTVLVVLMSSKAMSVGFLFPGTHTLLIALGGGCFVVSDMVLGIWAYRSHKKWLVLCNRIVYFAGQLLFALALMFG